MTALGTGTHYHLHIHVHTHTNTYTHVNTHIPLGEPVRLCGKENEGWPQVPLTTKRGEAPAQDCWEKKCGQHRTCEEQGSGAAELSLHGGTFTLQF